jgi:catechol 2,3-dioxygenase-like lactoylglutathione lyase family enzyme
MSIQFGKAVPVFRIFSLEKAREFYLDFLGFKVDWEARFDADAPVYMQVSRGGLAPSSQRASRRRHAGLDRVCLSNRRRRAAPGIE